MTNDAVGPALTPEEWAECVSIDASGTDPLTCRILEDGAKAMCWINGNMPDHDPRKITHSIVAALEEVYSDALSHLDDRATPAERREAEAEYLAPARAAIAALRGLLPPE